MTRTLAPRTPRRGNTLIVTLSCLALLAVVGISAVYFARDQAERARIQGQSGAAADNAIPDDGTGALNQFLGVWLYDDSDSGKGMINSVRGHSLVATMYSRVPGAFIPWNGVGSFGESLTLTVNGNSDTITRPNFLNYAIYGNGQTTWFDPERTGGRAPNGPITGTFIPMNAAYTYPDLKDIYLAVQCPATGEILQPSFYRTYSAFGSLAPNNPKWFSGPGVHEIPRPIQAFHPQFPFVPANADGTYTGDVQNLPGAFGPGGVQKNDSIWIDIGLPPITLPNGKRVKPLVAPLILDLDGRLNLSVHGNRLNGGAHTSGAGIGPWEVSLFRSLGAEGQNLVLSRGSAVNRAGTNSKAYSTRIAAIGNQLQRGSAVAWTASGGSAGGSAPGVAVSQGSLNLPGYGGNSLYATTPAYNPTYAGAVPGYDSTDALVANHPSLFNPTEWPAAGGLANRGYPVSDAKLLFGKYAAPPSFYAPMVVGPFAPTTLRGTAPLPNPYPPQAGTASGYRLDAAHTSRHLVTPYAYGLDRTGLTPGTNQTTALSGALGGIDLNRPLTDYRANPALPLSPGNMNAAVAYGTGTVLQADIDRQLLARDVFARLVAATNAAGATVSASTGAVTITEPAGTANYNKLRSLAQFAANIVDYIDEDDVSTTFVWNPAAWADPFAAANYLNAANAIVYGVEKPRLVINEAYAEIVNDPNDANATANGKASNGLSHVRFWMELLNPSATPYSGGATAGPLGDGSAWVRYSTGGNYGTVNYTGASYSPYQIQVARGATAAGGVNAGVVTYLATPSNVTGGFDPTLAPDIQFQFDKDLNAAANRQVSPNNATYNPAGVPGAGILLLAAQVTNARTDEFNPNTGAAPWSNAVIAPQPTAAGTLAVPNDAMAYITALPTNPNQQFDIKRHVVLLRRLANPYLPGPSAANPYVTVDYMDYVPAFDSVTKVSGQMVGRNAQKGKGNAGYTAPVDRSSLGKVQPYAGLCVAGAADANNNPSFAFPTSMALYQLTGNNAGNDPNHTFGRHNGLTVAGPTGQTYVAGPPAKLVDPTSAAAETLMTPFDWSVHLDRPVVNQLELLHAFAGTIPASPAGGTVPMARPADYTQELLMPSGGSVNKFPGSAMTSLLSNTFPQLYQALDMLRVRPYGQMTALGGRLPGRININTIQDKRVWDALFDAQGYNGFTQAQVDAAWEALIRSRTVNTPTLAGPGNRADANGNQYWTPIPGTTIYDTNGNNGDRPFLPLGVSTVNPGGYVIGGSAPVYARGTSADDSFLLRGIAGGSPALLNAGATHPYQQVEAARKVLNNTTTVSHSFAVWVTVGYFEVTAETPSAVGTPPFVQLGKEYYRDVPGDTRQKFFAVVDRSTIGMDPYQFASGNPVHYGTSGTPNLPPFFTTVEANVTAGTSNTITVYAPGGFVYANGNPVQIMTGTTLVVGTGANAEIVTVQTAAAGANGLTTVTIGGVIWTPSGGATPAAPVAAFTRNHYPGESVSNVMPGNPGPQTGFDVNLDMYKAVVPLWARLP